MYVLTITRETYSPTDSGKGWKSKPDNVETDTFPWHRTDADDLYGEEVHRRITAPHTLTWFRRIGGSETATRSYTPVGFIVTRLVSTNPDRTVRIVRKFRITDVPSN